MIKELAEKVAEASDELASMTTMERQAEDSARLARANKTAAEQILRQARAKLDAELDKIAPKGSVK